MQKVDVIVAENPSTSLDDLVASRKINNDQKAQIQKKPALQTQLAQLEEQLATHKKLEDDFNKRLQAQKERLDAEHHKDMQDVKASAAEAAQDMDKTDLRAKLLVLSKFLRAAAARRQDGDESSDDSKGFEGVLLFLYGGDSAAVDAAEKLIDDSAESVTSTEGTTLPVTYSRVKALSLDYAPFATEEAWVDGVADASKDTPQEPPNGALPTDATITNAGLTEINDVTQPASIPPDTADLESGMPGPEQATISEAANTAATEQWDKAAPGGHSGADPLAESWVSIPRPLEETEQHSAATNAAISPNQTENWADMSSVPQESWGDVQTDTAFGSSPSDTKVASNDARSVPPSGDGFHEVHHGRGGRGRGSFGGEHRGRRGSFRGGDRGRGGFRGERGRGRGRGRGSRDAGAPAA